MIRGGRLLNALYYIDHTTGKEGQMAEMRMPTLLARKVLCDESHLLSPSSSCGTARVEVRGLASLTQA